MAQPSFPQEPEFPDDEFPEEEALFPEYSEEDYNLVPLFEEVEEGKTAIKDIVADVIAKFNQDWENDEPRRKRIADDFAVLAGELKKKDFPFENCANAHVPFALENTMRVHSRLCQEIFGDWKNVVGVQPEGKDDEAQATAMSIHDNWQMRTLVPDFQRQMERGLLAFLFIGEAIFGSSYDPERETNRHEALMPDEFVLPGGYVSTMPDLSDLPHYTRVLFVSQHKLEAHRDKWSHIDKVLGESFDGNDDETPLADRVTEIEGREVEHEPLDGSYRILQFEGWLALPGQDRQRWCQALVHPASLTLLLLTIHEEADWRDVTRYTRERQELEAYQAAYGEWSAATMRKDAVEEGIVSLLGQAEEQGRELGPEIDAQIDQVSQDIPPPPRPTWLRGDPATAEPAPLRMKQICLFSRSVCLENLLGTSGMGIGRMQADYNRAADTSLSQFTDTATLNNCPSWLTAGLKFPEGEPRFAPGKFIKVTGIDGSQLEKAVMPIRPGQANPQLLDVVDRMYGYAQAAAQAPDVLSGAPGKSGETFRGHSSRLEQATKQLGSYAQRFVVGVKQVYINNAYLNAEFLPESQVVSILDDHSGRFNELMLSRVMWQRNYNVEFTADMKFTSEAQRISEADEMLNMVMKIPHLASNPHVVYEAIKASLLARGQYALLRALGAPPEGQPQSFGPPPPPPGQPGMQPGQGPPQR